MITTIEWTATRVPLDKLLLRQVDEVMRMFKMELPISGDGRVVTLPGFTFNPWIGCSKVSKGCMHCYAEQQDKFRAWTPKGWGPGKPRRRTGEATWANPLRWNRLAEALGVRLKVFCASLADVFDAEVPVEWRRDLFALIEQTPHLDYLLLTKRPQNWRTQIENAQQIAGAVPDAHGWLLRRPNVWIGVSVEDQDAADERIPILLQMPARVRFLSCEPLLGPVDLRQNGWLMTGGWTHHPEEPSEFQIGAGGIDWVIVGGESGAEARPFDITWARSLVRQCAASGTAVFVKQLGARPVHHVQRERTHANFAYSNPPHIDPLKLADRKGGDMAEWPEDLRVRQWPAALEEVRA